MEPRPGKATVHYADGTTQTAALGGPDRYSGSDTLTAPYRRNQAGQKDPHQVVIATAEVAMDPTKDAVALTLPLTNPAEPNKSALHIFALTLQPAAQGRALMLREAHSTRARRRPPGRQAGVGVQNSLVGLRYSRR
ncbi:hypothetical protein ACFYRC_06610 [Streptomyces sp. NPDC005279]|uniref:hypothetical protein n=1 Tax=Streptomyces sp. NPDC005279 TaxID=3364712 RepID=UPI00367A0966